MKLWNYKLKVGGEEGGVVYYLGVWKVLSNFMESFIEVLSKGLSN